MKQQITDEQTGTDAAGEADNSQAEEALHLPLEMASAFSSDNKDEWELVGLLCHFACYFCN